MTLARPASRTAASNGSSCSSRSSRGPTWAGAWLSPPSARPWPTRCLPVATTPVARSSPWMPAHVGDAERGREVRVLAVGLLDAAPARVAGDVEDRRERLPRRRSPASAGGSSSRSPRRAPGRTPPPRRSTAGTRSRRGRAGRGASPRGGSPGSRAASPRRGSAGSRCRPSAAPGGVEVRRAGDPADLADPVARAGPRTRSGSSSVSLRNSSNDQIEPSWASFSSSVIRASRSATRCSIGRLGSR